MPSFMQFSAHCCFAESTLSLLLGTDTLKQVIPFTYLCFYFFPISEQAVLCLLLTKKKNIFSQKKKKRSVCFQLWKLIKLRYIEEILRKQEENPAHQDISWVWGKNSNNKKGIFHYTLVSGLLCSGDLPLRHLFWFCFRWLVFQVTTAVWCLQCVCYP